MPPKRTNKQPATSEEPQAQRPRVEGERQDQPAGQHPQPPLPPLILPRAGRVAAPQRPGLPPPPAPGRFPVTDVTNYSYDRLGNGGNSSYEVEVKFFYIFFFIDLFFIVIVFPWDTTLLQCFH